jgi:hypothetical protein
VGPPPELPRPGQHRRRAGSPLTRRRGAGRPGPELTGDVGVPSDVRFPLRLAARLHPAEVAVHRRGAAAVVLVNSQLRQGEPTGGEAPAQPSSAAARPRPRARGATARLATLPTRASGSCSIRPIAAPQTPSPSCPTTQSPASYAGWRT